MFFLNVIYTINKIFSEIFNVFLPCTFNKFFHFSSFTFKFKLCFLVQCRFYVQHICSYFTAPQWVHLSKVVLRTSFSRDWAAHSPSTPASSQWWSSRLSLAVVSWRWSLPSSQHFHSDRCIDWEFPDFSDALHSWSLGHSSMCRRVLSVSWREVHRCSRSAAGDDSSVKWGCCASASWLDATLSSHEFVGTSYGAS